MAVAALKKPGRFSGSLVADLARRVETQGRPIRIGLIGYRDRGDEYVTKAFDLTNDIDAVYGHLQAFHAAGGGDTPESVNEALQEGVNKMTWSQDRKVLKIIFLVGDAPPHMDYPGAPKYPEVCQRAMKRDLIINTVQCGAFPRPRRSGGKSPACPRAGLRLILHKLSNDQ